jgi:hypothetical protein
MIGAWDTSTIPPNPASLTTRRPLQVLLPETLSDNLSDTFSALQWLGMASALVGAASLGLYIGRELRLRYKFHRRTPSDFFSNAGDPITNTEYGMGI